MEKNIYVENNVDPNASIIHKINIANTQKIESVIKRGKSQIRNQ